LLVAVLVAALMMLLVAAAELADTVSLLVKHYSQAQTIQ
jgi:NADH:ubiquinone oxidoreductase subunit K